MQCFTPKLLSMERWGGAVYNIQIQSCTRTLPEIVHVNNSPHGTKAGCDTPIQIFGMQECQRSPWKTKKKRKSGAA